MRANIKFVPLLVICVLVSCVCIQPPEPGTPTPPPTATVTLIPASTAATTIAPMPTTATIPTLTPTNGPAGPGFGFGGASGQVGAEPLDTAIRLRWTPVPGAQGYLIYRDGYSEPLDAAPIQDTTYDDIGLTTGRVYSYTVAAVDPTGQVIWRSAEVAAAAGGR